MPSDHRGDRGDRGVSANTGGASGSQSSKNQNVQILSRGTDGSVIEAHIFSDGAIVAEVVSKGATTQKSLGNIKSLVDSTKGHETLQARCKSHKNCMCWLSSNRHSDLLLQWLCKGDQESFEQHQTAAKELKKSIGMKIRG